MRFIRLSELTKITGLSKSTIERLRAAGDFPEPFSLGPRSVAWKSTDIEEWIESRQPVTHNRLQEGSRIKADQIHFVIDKQPVKQVEPFTTAIYRKPVEQVKQVEPFTTAIYRKPVEHVKASDFVVVVK